MKSIDLAIVEVIIIGSIVGSAIIIVKSLNPIYSILNLIILYFSYACYLIFIEMEFLACILILVNVGAVAVLFLFIVMMININVVEIKETVKKYYPYVIIGVLGITSILYSLYLDVVIEGQLNTSPKYLESIQEHIQFYDKFNKTIELKAIGSNILYGSSFGLWLILACVILLIGMIGVIYITEDLIKLGAKNKRKQNIYDQIAEEVTFKIKGIKNDEK